MMLTNKKRSLDYNILASLIIVRKIRTE